MNVRLLTQLATVAALVAWVLVMQPRSDRAAMAGRSGDDPALAGDAEAALAPPVEQRWVSLDEAGPIPEPVGPVAPQAIDAADAPLSPRQDCQYGGIGRLFSESFDRTDWPRGTKWTVADAYGLQPGVIDDIVWGRETCESTVGGSSLWAVGAGRVGNTLLCDGPNKGYPTVPRANGKGVRSLLRYSPIDLSPSRIKGVRITFDYMAKMPAGALFVGMGDSEKIENNAISYEGYTNFDADTGGQWRRGVMVQGEPFNKLAGVEKAILGFFYSDPPPEGAGPLTAGMYGVLIDNVHIDILNELIPIPCPIESPTVTQVPPTRVSPSATPTRTETATQTPFVIPSTKTPTPTPTKRVSFVRLPILLRSYTFPDRPTPIPTVPTPTITPSPTATSTETLTPTPTASRTRTPEPSDTPTRTPTPTDTPIPYPDVQIIAVRSVTLGAEDLEFVRVANLGTGPQLMTDWRVFSRDSTKSCYFNDGFNLQAGEVYELRRGRDATNGIRQDVDLGPSDGKVCEDKAWKWNDQLDKATLYDQNEVIRDTYCYDKSGPFYCE